MTAPAPTLMRNGEAVVSHSRSPQRDGVAVAASRRFTLIRRSTTRILGLPLDAGRPCRRPALGLPLAVDLDEGVVVAGRDRASVTIELPGHSPARTSAGWLLCGHPTALDANSSMMRRGLQVAVTSLKRLFGRAGGRSAHGLVTGADIVEAELSKRHRMSGAHRPDLRNAV